MAQAFRIETLDRSGRWYLTPGSRSTYDLRIRNDSKNAVDCSLVVEDPTAGVSVEPDAFSLRGHELRTVTVTFTPEATSVRQHRILLSLHADDDGRLLATFEHPLVATGGTDCSVAMAFRSAIVEAGELRGFEMTCSVRSQSEARSTFQVSLSPHMAFTIPELPALSLEPGQVGEVVIPIRWNRTVKDNNGWNHPAIFELIVPVSNGRRTSRMRWELIESKLEPFLKDSAGSANGAVASPQAAVKTEPASSAPEAKPAIVEPPKTATVITMPAAPAQAVPSRAAASPAAQLMLNGYVERLMLAAPIDAKPSATAKPSTNVATATMSRATELRGADVELSLFAANAEPVTKPSAQPNGKHESVSENTPATVSETIVQAPAAPPAAKQSAPAQPPPTQPAPSQSKPQQSGASAPTVQPARAPQWKIVSAAESIEASTAQARSAPAVAPVAQAPAAQAPPPAAPAAPPPSVAAPADMNATAQTAPQPVPAGPPPKLTPYAPAKWDSADENAVPAQAARATAPPAKTAATAEKVAAPIPDYEAALTSSPTRVLRARQTIELPQRRPRPGLLIGGLAAVAIVIGIIIFKPTSPQTQATSTTPATVATPVVAVNQGYTAEPVVHSHIAVKPKLMAKPNVAATSAPVATPKPATPTAAAAAPAKPKPAAQKPAVLAARPPAAPRHVARYGKLYQPESGSVVALGGIEAFYGPRGRAVRVIWSAAEQASASVQLIDYRGTTVNSVNVRGGRQSVILYLPRGYHGGLTVQVSSIGRLGERVAQTTSLPPFGN